MKIIYLAAYFYPEKYASDFIYTSVLEELAKENEVHVIAPQPCRGVSDEEYQNFAEYEEKDGLIIHRFKMKKEGSSTVGRFLRYKKCESGYKKIAKEIGKADFIFSASTPPTMGVFASKLAKKLGAKAIYSLQDLFPDSLVSTGILKKPSGPIWWLGKSIEKKTYKNADKIAVISQNFYDNLLSKGVAKEKLALIPNFIDLEEVEPISKENNKLFEEFGIDKNKFNVVYAGNMGSAQGAEIILEVAERLKSERGIQFIVFGGGAEYGDFETAVKERNLTNVTVNPLLPKERISEVYSLGDASLIICKKGVGKTALPSKTWSIMACNTPIIASFDLDSELAEIIKKANAGVCVPAGDADELAKAVLDLKDKPISVCSRQYLQENLSKETLIKKYLELFKAEE